MWVFRNSKFNKHFLRILRFEMCRPISTCCQIVNTVIYVNAREWFTCTSRCSNHTVTCPVLIVTWTVDGFSRSLDSHCMRSEIKAASKRLIDCILCFHFQLKNIQITRVLNFKRENDCSRALWQRKIKFPGEICRIWNSECNWCLAKLISKAIRYCICRL